MKQSFLRCPQLRLSHILSKPIATLLGNNDATFLPAYHLGKFRFLKVSNQLPKKKPNEKDNLDALFSEEIKLASKLKETRIRLNASQTDVAKAIGASHQSVSRYERLGMSPDNWRKWQAKIISWAENPVFPSKDTAKAPRKFVKAMSTIERHKVALESYFEKDPKPSRHTITQVAQELGLDEKTVTNWFAYQRKRKAWVSTKLKDKSYMKNLNISVKMAIEFLEEFENTRKVLNHSLHDVACSPYWPYSHPTIGQFVRKNVSEKQLVKYHQCLEKWMTNLPESKESAKNRFLLEKHKEYLKEVFESEQGTPSNSKIKEIADETGISFKSLYNTFAYRRLSAGSTVFGKLK